jgi:4'-phosphopantetheinyl transferase
MTTVYYTKCKRLPEEVYSRAMSALPESMQQRLGRYNRWQDAHSYLYGKLLLKEGMLRMGYCNSLQSMKTTPYGKPYFDNENFGFNMSHSEAYVVCVISDDEKKNLGIDIEKISPIKISSFDSILSSREKKEIDGIEKFYRCWTRKEAIIKADGKGLHIPLETIDTTNSRVKLGNDTYHLLSVDLDKDYMVHIASLNKIEKINVNKVFAERNFC